MLGEERTRRQGRVGEEGWILLDTSPRAGLGARQKHTHTHTHQPKLGWVEPPCQPPPVKRMAARANVAFLGALQGA